MDILNFLRGLLGLNITRAPPWCFPPIIQSCLWPRIRPPINNPPTVKLPTSCQRTLPAWWCLLGGTRSLIGPSLFQAFYLLLRSLVLFVPDSLPPIFAQLTRRLIVLLCRYRDHLCFIATRSSQPTWHKAGASKITWDKDKDDNDSGAIALYRWIQWQQWQQRNNSVKNSHHP